MKKVEYITYIAPPFESVQHEVTRFGDKEKPLETSLHSDVSLMMRIDKLTMSARQIEVLKEQLQPIIDKSNYRAEFEESFGKLTDDDLIKSCPSRYLQTASEQKQYLSDLAQQHKVDVEKNIKAQKDAEEKKRMKDEENQLSEAIRNLISD